MIDRIESKEQHEAALKRIEEIWDTAQPGTPEEEEFDRLADLIEAYEDIHYPMGSQRKASQRV